MRTLLGQCWALGTLAIALSACSSSDIVSPGQSTETGSGGAEVNSVQLREDPSKQAVQLQVALQAMRDLSTHNHPTNVASANGWCTSKQSQHIDLSCSALGGVSSLGNKIGKMDGSTWMFSR